ncbi:MAG: hypothetical protein ACK4K7_06795 [Allosphingosinicella sp.]|uniref:hypothetical protein n=1 Tax=Allosphingosinicella sp. TaxID=2823234 RepID=UPI003949B087
MEAESLFPPIREEDIRQAKARIVLEGEDVSSWARKNGYDPKLVHQVLSGTRQAIRGKSLKVALALGLRRLPSSPAPAHRGDLRPTSRSLTDDGPLASGNRRRFLPIGEPVR